MRNREACFAARRQTNAFIAKLHALKAQFEKQAISPDKNDREKNSEFNPPAELLAHVDNCATCFRHYISSIEEFWGITLAPPEDKPPPPRVA